jgi:hypothetical protein
MASAWGPSFVSGTMALMKQMMLPYTCTFTPTARSTTVRETSGKSPLCRSAAGWSGWPHPCSLVAASADSDGTRASPFHAGSQGPVGCPAASTGWRPRCQRRLHRAQCDIWRQPHSHVRVPCAVVYVHRQCSPCLRHPSHRGTGVGIRQLPHDGRRGPSAAGSHPWPRGRRRPAPPPGRGPAASSGRRPGSRAGRGRCQPSTARTKTPTTARHSVWSKASR